MIENLVPLISVIVPVYNVENYVEKCIDSLIDQTLANIEIIIVDDGSTDKSSIICDEYAKQYHNIKVIHKVNGGLGSARNVGMKEARGRYIGFVDSDDYVSTRMYESLWILAENYNADCVYCDYERFWGCKVEVSSPQKDVIKVYSGNEIINSYLLDRVGCIPTEEKDCSYGASVCLGIFRNSLIQNNKIKFVSEREIIAEDMIFDIDFIPFCKKIVHTSEALYFYRFNPNSLTTRYVSDRFERNVALCNEMSSRLRRIYDSEIYKIRVDRYFLKITRIALIEEVKHIRENGYMVAKQNFKRIAKNEELNRIFVTYPVGSLPIKQRFFFYAVKRDMFLLVVIFIVMNRSLKKLKSN